MKKFKGNRPLAIIKREVLKRGGEWRQDKYDAGSDYVSFTFEGKEIAYNTFNGTFIVRVFEKGEERFVTERDKKMDGVKWYDAILDLLYEPLEKEKVS